MHSHPIVMLVALGLVLLPGVLVMHFATHWTYMARKVSHATLQATGVALLGVGLALADGTDGAEGTQRLWHTFFGYVLLLGGVPWVLLARLPSLRPWHNASGRLLLVLLSANAVLGAWGRDDRVMPLAIAVFVAHAGVALWTWTHSYPTLAAVVQDEEEAGYRLREPYATHPERLRELQPAGAGWTSLLQHRVWTRQPQVFTRSLQGERPNGRWGAGTSIRAVQQTLARRGQTLSAHPSVLGATLGGWVATSSHGSGGAQWTPPLGRRTVLDLHTAVVRDLAATDPHVAGRHLVLDVAVRPVPNLTVVRRAFELRGAADAARFFAPDTYARALFVDAHQALCFVWTTCTDPPPSTCPAPLPPWLATILPGMLARHLSRARWDNVPTSLAKALHFSPDPPYFGGLAALCYTNFELFVRPSVSWTPARLVQLCMWLQSLFRSGAARGRCEVRYEHGTLFLDFALLGSAVPDRVADWIAQLRAHVVGSAATVTFHPGKWQVPLS